MNEQIKEALEKDVDLTAEEYREKTLAADANTKAHGVKHTAPGRVPVSEKTRHDRIEMNFYGTALNILMGIYSTLTDIDAKITAILTGGVTNADADERNPDAGD